MPNTYAALAVHAIFATKRRECALSAGALARLPGYVGGILDARGCVCLAVGGFHDHLHVVVSHPPRLAVADILRQVKGGSSQWLRKNFPEMQGFCWQDGYAAYSVSPSQVERAIRYVESQDEHHRVRNFEEEYLDLLHQGGVECDERYVFGPRGR
ncbi:MAG: IS200/IS605 family transposase [Bryobacterales bacterium]|nr:IS200/IS605 family transposase [Bryobacterales bacterium]